MTKRELTEQRAPSCSHEWPSRDGRRRSQYIQANKDSCDPSVASEQSSSGLEAKAKEEGVKALPKGIYYKVLSEGNAESAKPTVRSIVTAHYTGKTINGKTFDSSRGRAFSQKNTGAPDRVPLACRLCDLIEGWIIAMQQMHIGDKWEVYIPAEMGYGKFFASKASFGRALSARHPWRLYPDI